MIDDKAIDDLLAWMIDGARPSANAREIVEGICMRLSEAGVSVDRFMLFIYTLHPNLMGRRFRWQPGEAVDMAEAPMSILTSEEYNTNPLPDVLKTRKTVRRHLSSTDCPEDYAIVEQLRNEGFSDYLVQPLNFTTGDTNACTWASKADGGFSNEMIAILEQVNGPLARLTETYMLRLNASTLLSTYVGRNCGEQILSGSVHRGDGEQISAVIMFVDIKDFTKLSNSQSGEILLEMLNNTFDALVPPIEEFGGEILKFMGDGFFAIFPYEDKAGITQATSAAVRAVNGGRDNMAQLGEGKDDTYRTALHFGDFHYGNIGGSNRLDFTAIGPAVNYTARLLGAATELEVDRVLSAELANYIENDAEEIGSVSMKGFDGVQTIFGF